MKIDRLYTLSQFVDKMKENVIKGHEFYHIIEWNEFLKQPLKKEMREKLILITRFDEKYFNLGIKLGYTLEWFANKTNGQLKLKKVEI